ncbi:hypothetical protein [Heyndrickxia ginsengihumi]|uniref:hypothetical protein n=1 Tax=Heyndrickxia ginsengihumi TaxID=363870 RepID=UPI0004711B6B|nr:hypothetical protein [Heyndrickxia ginsengihumi]
MVKTKEQKVKKAQKKVKKIKKKSLWKEGRALFSGISIFLQLMLYFCVNFIISYLLLENIVMSVILGVIGGFWSYTALSVLQVKTTRYQRYLRDLMKYVTTMTFHLKTGRNEMAAFRATREAVPKHIQIKIDKVLDIMENEARLDTSVFKEYDFPTLDIFHQILDIKYTHGGDPNVLFNPINMMMSDEIAKRDNLYRRKKGKAFQLISMWVMVLCIPLLLVIMPSTLTLYKIFLKYKIASIGIVTIFYLCMLWTLVTIQKAKVNIALKK